MYYLNLLKLKLLFITICCGFWSVALEAQRVSSCAELGLQMLQSDESQLPQIPNGRCWVYHHTNNRDLVVTPESWGVDPPDPYGRLIKDVLETLGEARSAYEDYGTLNSRLIYVIDEVTRPNPRGGVSAGLTFWIARDTCWMVSGTPDLTNNSEQNKHFFAHEVGHCLVMENVTNLRTFYNSNNWFDESVCEFLASEVNKVHNLEHTHARNFDLDGAPFQQIYPAYPLWYYFTKVRGKSSLFPYLEELAAIQNANQRLDYMRDTGFDQLYHHFLFHYYQDELLDPGRGIIPKESYIDTLDYDFLTPELTETKEMAPIPSERLSIIYLDFDTEHDLIIEPPPGAGADVFYSIISDYKVVKNWTEKVEIKGSCREETKVKILVSHLTGSPIENIKFKVELKDRDYCCPHGMTGITENPSEERLDGVFTFDYYIESEIYFETSEESDRIPLNYYVNSKDGSMLLTDSWFNEAYGSTESKGWEAEAVVWLPNGQLVGYVYDKNSAQKRAITLDLNQKKGDVLSAKALKVEQFLRQARGSGLRPPPLPPGSNWQGNARGVSAYQTESSNPSERNLISAYISDTTNTISSPLSSFGFMAGYIRDLEGKGRLMGYSQVVRPNGEFFETHLLEFYKACAFWDGAGYKKMSLGGNTGAISAMSETERDAWADRQNELQKQLMQTIASAAACNGDKTCEAEIQRRAMAIQKQIQDEYYGLTPDRNLSGTAGSDFQAEQKAIQERMYTLENQIIDKELQCQRLSEQNARCGGCVKSALESCKDQHQQLLDRMVQLECEMARLHGVDDALEECR